MSSAEVLFSVNRLYLVSALVSTERNSSSNDQSSTRRPTAHEADNDRGKTQHLPAGHLQHKEACDETGGCSKRRVGSRPRTVNTEKLRAKIRAQ